MTPPRDFALGDVLSIATDRLVSRRGVEALYEILNFMTGDNLFTHQLPRAMRECRPHILRQHPSLADISVEGLSNATWETWLADQERRFGETLPLQPIPRDDHAFRDPVQELEEMVGPEKVIVVEPPGEHA